MKNITAYLSRLLAHYTTYACIVGLILGIIPLNEEGDSALTLIGIPVFLVLCVIPSLLSAAIIKTKNIFGIKPY